jgi:hypothetical protein
MILKRALLLVSLTVAVVAATSLAPAAAKPQAAPSATIVRNFIRSSFCSPSGTTTTFAIPSGAELESQYEAVPSQIWIDLTLFQNGYAPGTFLAAGPFPAGPQPASFDWSGMLVSVQHFYRVNALFPDGWKTIGSEKITTPDCVRILRYDCHSGATGVTMEWNVPPAAPVAGSTPVAQWIDITLGSSRFLGGFAAGGPIAGSGGQFTWPGVASQRRHNYRINARYSGAFNGWRIQGTGQFTTPDCRQIPGAAS